MNKLAAGGLKGDRETLRELNTGNKLKLGTKAE